MTSEISDLYPTYCILQPSLLLRICPGCILTARPPRGSKAVDYTSSAVPRWSALLDFGGAKSLPYITLFFKTRGGYTAATHRTVIESQARADATCHSQDLCAAEHSQE